MATWSELPLDLAREIVKKIDTVEDFIVFSSLCSAWRSAAVKDKEDWFPSAQLPWLIFSDYEEPGQDHNIAFFSLYKNERYNLYIPERCYCNMWGSGYGWFVVAVTYDEMFMLNPLSRLKIYLPQWNQSGAIKKVLVSKSRAGELVVAATFGIYDFLAITRPGDESWQEVYYEWHFRYADIVCFNGQIFAVGFGGTLFLCDIDGPDAPKATKFAHPPADYDPRGVAKHYLVESMGDLLMVACSMRDKKEYKLEYTTTHFDVYKFDLETKEWTKLDNLGDRALFIDENYSVSVPSTEVPGCEGNCIYFKWNNWWTGERDSDVGHDKRVFNLEENKVHPLPLPPTIFFDALYSRDTTPWLIPSFF